MYQSLYTVYRHSPTPVHTHTHTNTQTHTHTNTQTHTHVIRVQATGPGTYTCSCTTGWTGTDCNTNIDECSPNPPCVRGTCIDCTPTGPILIDISDNTNTTICPHGYICDCPAGFFGANCDIDIDACDPNQCVNGGLCEDVIGGPGYTCMCPSGYTGVNCETDVNECLSNPSPCLNGGTCSVSETAFNFN